MIEQPDAQSTQPPESQKQPLIVNNEGEVKGSPESENVDISRSVDDAKERLHQTTVSDKNNTGSTSMPESQNNVQQHPTIIQHRSGGKVIATGALIFSLLALAASGFLFVEGQNLLKNQQLQFDHKIDAAGIDSSKTAVTVQTSLARIDELTRQLQTLQQQQKIQGESTDKLNRTYQELVKSRSDWLVDEIEATLNLISQQLLISGNVSIAVNVMENLESRLSRFDQPQLLPIKKALSSDLEALKNRPYLDVASVSLRLNRLESAIAGLPLVVDSQLQPNGAQQLAPTANSNTSWWQRTWQNTLYSLKGMVEIRHLNHNDSMLMSPDQTFFVRENLRLRLMDARIALVQRLGEIYTADLNGAEATVKQYFDGNSVATKAWLAELMQLKSLNVQNNQDVSFLSASLMAVRDYQKQSGMDMSTALPDLGASAVNNSSASEEKPTSQENKSSAASSLSAAEGEHIL